MAAFKEEIFSGRRSHDVQDRRGGDQLERDRVQAVGSRPVRLRERAAAVAFESGMVHQRPDRQRGPAAPFGGSILEQRRYFSGVGQIELWTSGSGDLAGEGRAVPFKAGSTRRRMGRAGIEPATGLKSLLYQLS